MFRCGSMSRGFGSSSRAPSTPQQSRGYAQENIADLEPLFKVPDRSRTRFDKNDRRRKNHLEPVPLKIISKEEFDQRNLFKIPNTAEIVMAREYLRPGVDTLQWKMPGRRRIVSPYFQVHKNSPYRLMVEEALDRAKDKEEETAKRAKEEQKRKEQLARAQGGEIDNSMDLRELKQRMKEKMRLERTNRKNEKKNLKEYWGLYLEGRRHLKTQADDARKNSKAMQRWTQWKELRDEAKRNDKHANAFADDLSNLFVSKKLDATTTTSN